MSGCTHRGGATPTSWRSIVGEMSVYRRGGGADYVNKVQRRRKEPPSLSCTTDVGSCRCIIANVQSFPRHQHGMLTGWCTWMKHTQTHTQHCCSVSQLSSPGLRPTDDVRTASYNVPVVAALGGCAHSRVFYFAERERFKVVAERVIEMVWIKWNKWNTLYNGNDGRTR